MGSQRKNKGKTKQEKRWLARMQATAGRRVQSVQAEAATKKEASKEVYVSPSMRILAGFLAQSSMETVYQAVSKQAALGSPTASMILGTMLREGIGVGVDYAEAARCFQLGVDKDLDEAYGCLGSLYGEGLGVPLDLEKAHALLAEGAKR
ncbi:MAG: sel1 repeat family protein, partial [Desulfovibrio sp.]|nr:sel1 repeat family protein [Desulfovibrio sp.]